MHVGLCAHFHNVFLLPDLIINWCCSVAFIVYMSYFSLEFSSNLAVARPDVTVYKHPNCAYACFHAIKDTPHIILKFLPTIHFYDAAGPAIAIGCEQHLSIRDQVPLFFQVLSIHFRWLPLFLPFHDIFPFKRDFSISQARLKQHGSFWVVY